MNKTDQPPIACTLSVQDYKTRSQWMQRLAVDLLQSARRHDLTLHLRYRRAAASEIHRLVAEEQACCAFLRFDIRETADSICVDISAPARARAAADVIFAQFAPMDFQQACQTHNGAES